MKAQIGSYRLVRELGRGGMGTVYEAVQIVSGESRALKVFTLDHGNREFLINAVQYQCSLASAGRLVPDGVKGKVFCQCMEQEVFQDSLRSRIEGAKELCDDIILVNACTRDSNGEGYKAVSKILLRYKNEGFRVFGTTHPSGWQCPRNRVIQKLNWHGKLPSISPCRCE